MTVEDVKRSIKELKSQGWNEEEILGAFYAMFQDGKINLDELGALSEVLGYQLTDEFLNMSPEEQKTKGYEEIDEDETIESSALDYEMVIQQLREDGYNEEQIKLMIGMMYVDGKIDLPTLKKLCLELTSKVETEFDNLSERKIKKIIKSRYDEYMAKERA